MLSITNITASQAVNYYNSKDDYYAKENPGQWYGDGALSLGLKGDVDREVFEKLLYGKSPDGSDLIQSAPNGEHRAGIDLTFSAPKSVSIMALAFNDKYLEKAINDAHNQAVKDTLSFVQHYIQARETHDGITERTNTDNGIWALFNHNLTRELDPQVHTHAVLLNMSQREDGKWVAISNEQLYEIKMLAGQWYRNELAYHLRQSGIEIESNSKGLFEAKGISDELIKAFSSRTEQIDTKFKELREKYPRADEQKLREWATLDSRQSKKDVDIESLRGAWKERVDEIGHGVTLTNLQERKEKPLGAQVYVTIAGKALEAQESVFSKEDILRHSLKLSVGRQTGSAIENAFHKLVENNTFIKLHAGKEIYTTPRIIEMEKDCERMVLNGKGQEDPICDREQADKIIRRLEERSRIDGRQLEASQKAALKHILTSQDRVIGIQGDAGVGKTFTFGKLRELIEDSYTIIGLAPTGKAAAELQAVGISSSTIDSFLLSNPEKLGIGNKTIFLADEMSMVGTYKMHALLQKADEFGARVVMVGDTKQLQAIDAGCLFSKLQERKSLEVVSMNDVVRQKNSPEYLDLVNDVSSKRIDRAFEKLARGKLTEISERSQRIELAISDYTRGDHLSKILIVGRNSDRNLLNHLTREELKSQGKLPAQEHVFTVRESKGLNPMDKHFAHSYNEGDIIYAQKAGVIGKAGTEATITSLDSIMNTAVVQTKDGQLHTIDLLIEGNKINSFAEKQQSFAEGDKIVFLKNDRALGANNGSTGVIKNVDEHGNIRTVLDNGKDLTFNIGHYPYVDHGYAVTDYKSQGQTAREVIVYTDTARSGSTYNSFYVAITRGKDDVRVYTDNADALKEQVKQEQQKTSSLDYKEDPLGNQNHQAKEESQQNHLNQAGRPHHEMEVNI